MPQFIALLRGSNVGGRAIVPMAALRDLFGELGFVNVQTLLQSGNVVFDADRTTPAAAQAAIEAALFTRFKKKIGTSKITGAVIEKTLATPGTARNWNTITKLIALAEELKDA
jgi:uncharacterized protein (DUF1697 family)